MRSNVARLHASPQRVANPIVVSQLERIKARISYAIEEYENTALPNSRVEFNLVQAVHSIKEVQKELHLV